MKVLVCDDREMDAGKHVKRTIEKTTGHETELWSARDLKEEIAKFFKCRVEPVLKGAYSRQTQEDDSSIFCTSGFDIAILDNNLSELELGGTRQTAESIAGYLRAFGNIPYVVSLNKNPHVDFDLRHLVGDHETLADLAVNEAHLSNPALWTGDPEDATDDFLPWYWPALNDAPPRRRAQTRFVAEHFDKPILKSLGFPASATHSLSRHAKGALSPEVELATSLARVTFRTFFVKACRSLPIRSDRENLARAAAQREELARTVTSRIVAGELDRWFRRDVLGPQDVLVDLPHLLMRLPFLLGPHAQHLERWNHALTVAKPPHGLSREIYRKHIKPARFAHDVWTNSPSFWWRELKSDTELNRMFFADKFQWADVVFCEDRSRFESRTRGTNGQLEFAAEFEGTWNRRYIADLRGKHYVPKSRLVK